MTTITTGAEINQTFPASWYVTENDGTISGPFATEEQAQEAAETPAMTLESLNEFLTTK